MKKWGFAIIFCMAVLVGCGKGKEMQGQKGETVKFEPQMDASEYVTLSVVGYMDRFDAIEAVAGDFQEYYPNFELQYFPLEDYENNLEKRILGQEEIDIYMTYPRYFENSMVIADNSENLYEPGFDFSSMETVVFKDYFIEGKLKAIPLALNICGLVVNKSLLEGEGLSIPENLGQFMQACDKLVEKGYVPIQGNVKPVYFSLMRSEFMVSLGKSGNASRIFSELNYGANGSGEYLRDNLELFDGFAQRGYFDPDIISSYEDNYEQAALLFFEGDVPFLVTNLDTFSSMEGWEKKSNLFLQSPFEYEFAYAPLVDQGSCIYADAWAGFSVYNSSPYKEWANEFLRFLITTEELNKFASVKGMPTIAVNNTGDERFQELFGQRETSVVYHGEIAVSRALNKAYRKAMKKIAAGDIGVDHALMQIEQEVREAEG